MLIVMCEDKEAIENLDAIAATDGVDIVLVAPSDLSESLGLRGNQDALRKVYQDVAVRLRRIGKAKLGVPVGHRTLPFTPKELKAFGVACSSVHPLMTSRILNSIREDVAKIRAELAQA